MSHSCESCAHWATDQYTMPEGWGRCEMGRSEDGAPKVESTLAFASDAESYAADLLTSPRFLCYQFREKP